MKFKSLIASAVITVFILIITPFTSIAQDPDPGCDPWDPACPIDGGLSLLIAAGIGVGAKKAYDAKKKKQADL